MKCGIQKTSLDTARSRRHGATRRILAWLSRASAAPHMRDFQKPPSCSDIAKLCESRSTMDSLVLPTTHLAPARRRAEALGCSMCVAEYISFRRLGLPNFGRDHGHFRQHRSNFERKLGRFRALGRNRPVSNPHRPRFGPTSSKLWLVLAEIVRTWLVETGSNSAEILRSWLVSVELVPYWVSPVQFLLKSGQFVCC